MHLILTDVRYMCTLNTQLPRRYRNSEVSRSIAFGLQLGNLKDVKKSLNLIN